MIDLLHKHEYLKLEELMRLCPGTPRNKLESELKKVAEIERSGKNMNAYKLLPAYKSVCVCVLLCVVWGCFVANRLHTHTEDLAGLVVGHGGDEQHALADEDVHAQ